mgnify:FL=1
MQVQQGGDDRLRANKAIPAPDANAELPASIQVPFSSSFYIKYTIFSMLISQAIYHFHFISDGIYQVHILTSVVYTTFVLTSLCSFS